MTQSNFKYNTGQAGSTLFTPKKESKPFDPFDIQAASQPILNALKENKEVEIGDLQRTSDYGLDSMRIEHQHYEALSRHNAEVARLNDKYDLNQFQAFSTAATSLIQQGADIHFEGQKKKALSNFIALKVHNPELAAKLIEDWDQISDANDTIINSGALEGHLQLYAKKFPGDKKSLRLAQAWINASGYERQVLRKQMLGDQMKLIGERRALLKETYIPEWTKTEATPDGFTFQQMVNHDPGGSYTDEQFKKFETEISGIILERHFIPYHSTQTIATEVLPAFDKDLKDSALNRKATGELSQKGIFERNQNKFLWTTIDNSYGKDDGTIGKAVAKNIYELSGPLSEGEKLSDKMSAAWTKELNNLHQLYDSGAITYPQLLKAMHGEFKVDGQGLTSIDKWRSKEVAESGFWGKVDASMRRQENINKLNKENIINFGIKSMREQFLANDNRPIEETTFQLLVDKLHEMGGGIRSDIEEKLREAQPTVHGLRIEKELKNMSYDFETFGKLDPSLYSRYSHEAMVQARKNGWLEDPAHRLSATQLKNAREDISKAALNEAKNKGEENLDTINVEIRARRYFKKKYDDLVKTEKYKNNPKGAYDIALSQSVAEAKKLWPDWLKPLTEDEVINKEALNARKDIAKNVKQGASVQTYPIPVFDEPAEYMKQTILTAKKNGYTGDWRKLFDGQSTYPADDGQGGTVEKPLFGKTVTELGIGQGRFGVYEQQMRARKFDPDKGSNIKPIAPADNTNREINPPRVDVYHTETDTPFNMPEGGDKLIGKTFGEVTQAEWQDLGIPINKEFLKRMGFKPGYTIDENSLWQVSERWTRLDQGLVKAPTIFDNTNNKIKHAKKEDAKANRQLGDEKVENGLTYVYSRVNGPYYWGWKLKGGLLGALFGGGT